MGIERNAQRILIIGEELVKGLAIKKTLERLSYNCLSITPQKILKEQGLTFYPDLIISDLDWLSQLSLNTLTLGHSSFKALPIIYLDSDQVKRMSNQNVVGYLPTPIEFSKLEQMVASYFGRVKQKSA
jgi:DNA-binding NtrC family response regulator